LCEKVFRQDKNILIYTKNFSQTNENNFWFIEEMYKDGLLINTTSSKIFRQDEEKILLMFKDLNSKKTIEIEDNIFEYYEESQPHFINGVKLKMNTIEFNTWFEQVKITAVDSFGFTEDEAVNFSSKNWKQFFEKNYSPEIAVKEHLNNLFKFQNG
jgi:hypothetical protein